MFLSLCVFYIFVSNAVNADSTPNTSTYTHAGKSIKKSEGALALYAALHSNPPPINLTFYEKDVNQVRVPTKFYEEHKKKKIKKSPKRTIQKIIKKGKNRSRKIYVNPITRLPTVPSEKVEVQDSNANVEESTTENHKRKYRKNPKVPRYPMPFHKLQQKPSHFRNKREIDRKDVFIIKDLDELEFVDKGDDYDVIKTNVGQYW